MTSTEQSGEPSAEELQAYLTRLREADAREIVIQAYTLLGTGAEVKLGRRDARILIDAMAGLAQAVGPALGDEVATGMQGGVRQLQLAQVEAERQAAGQAGTAPAGAAAGQAAGQVPPAQTAAAPGAAAPGAAAPGQAGPTPGPGQQPGGDGEDQRMTDRLWIPGRGPRPARR